MYNITIVAVENECYILRVSIALVTQHAMRRCHIVTYGLSRSAILPHIISRTARFWRGKKVVEHKMCVLIFSTTFV